MTGRVCTAVLLLASLLTGGFAVASEQSVILTGRGLVEFHAANYSAALESFDQAVQSDATDAYARYYRGVTRGRLHEWEGAISDLRAVLALKPDLDQAALELGIAHVEAAAWADAVPWLQQAQRAPDLERKASYFLGVCELRLNHAAIAQREFRRAAEAEEFRLPARYYQGVAHFREQQLVSAAECFTYVAATSPDSEMGHQAAAYLAELRPFHLHGSLGFVYDSNVVLAPADDVWKAAVGISNQSDGAAEITAGGRYRPWATDRAQLLVGYDFYQSLYFNLADFDLQDHRASTELAVNLGVVQIGISGRYDYYLQGVNPFLQEAVAAPWMIVPEAGFGRSEILYRARWRGYVERKFNDRDAVNHLLALRQFVYLGRPARYLFVGYHYQREDMIDGKGNPFGYDGNQVEAGLGWEFPAGLATELSYAYQHDGYDAASDGREDNEHRVIFWVRKRLTNHLAVRCSYFGDFNDSNQAEFQYNRHVGSMAMEVRF